MLTFYYDLVIINENRGVIPEFSRERIRLIMKKTLSIVVALAMVFVMSFAVFAEGEDLGAVKPTDPTELGVYYAELLNAEDSDPLAVAAEIVADFQAGLVTIDNVSEVVEAFAGSVVDETKLIAVLEQVTTGLESLGVTLPNFDDILPPTGDGEEGEDGEEGGDDELLPDDNTSGGIGDFLNTILGILGSIGDMIFGGGSDTPSDDPAGDNGDDEWGDDEGLDGSDDDDLVPDTGDTTVLSVAAVALVAGAALVLTRKKSEDAE